MLGTLRDGVEFLDKRRALVFSLTRFRENGRILVTELNENFSFHIERNEEAFWLIKDHRDRVQEDNRRRKRRARDMSWRVVGKVERITCLQATVDLTKPRVHLYE